MRQYTRIVFGLNAVVQTVLGLLCLLAPDVMIRVFGGTAAEQSANLLQVVMRLIGANLVPVGVIAALIAGDPEETTVLRVLMGLQSVLRLVCWGIVFGLHILSATQIGLVVVDLLVQIMLLVALVFYMPHHHAAATEQLVVRRRAAA